MKKITDKTIGEIVAEDYRSAAVFEKYGIDFCCNGGTLFQDACTDNNINPVKLLEEIGKIQMLANDHSLDFKSWPLDLLVDYIEKKHHRYVEEKIPVLKHYLKKISDVHGKKHPELLKISELFNASAGELAAHMKKEEFMLFPYIRKMLKARHHGEQIEQPHFGTVENPVQMMMREHDNEGTRFREINNLSNNYLVPNDACSTYRVTYATLKEFEEDLHLHIHLENNILFPEAVTLEKEMTHE